MSVTLSFLQPHGLSFLVPLSRHLSSPIHVLCSRFSLSMCFIAHRLGWHPKFWQKGHIDKLHMFVGYVKIQDFCHVLSIDTVPGFVEQVAYHSKEIEGMASTYANSPLVVKDDFGSVMDTLKKQLSLR